MEIYRSHERIRYEDAQPELVDWGRAFQEGAESAARVAHMRADTEHRKLQIEEQKLEMPAKGEQAALDLIKAKQDREDFELHSKVNDAVSRQRLYEAQKEKEASAVRLETSKNKKETLEAQQQVEALSLFEENRPDITKAVALIQTGDVDSMRTARQVIDRLPDSVRALPQVEKLNATWEEKAQKVTVIPNGADVSSAVDLSTLHKRGGLKEPPRFATPAEIQRSQYLIIRGNELRAQGVPENIVQLKLAQEQQAHVAGLQAEMETSRIANEFRSSLNGQIDDSDIDRMITVMQQARTDKREFLSGYDSSLHPVLSAAWDKYEALYLGSAAVDAYTEVENYLKESALQGINPEDEAVFLSPVQKLSDNSARSVAIYLSAQMNARVKELKQRLGDPSLTDSDRKRTAQSLDKIKGMREAYYAYANGALGSQEKYLTARNTPGSFRNRLMGETSGARVEGFNAAIAQIDKLSKIEKKSVFGMNSYFDTAELTDLLRSVYEEAAPLTSSRYTSIAGQLEALAEPIQRYHQALQKGIPSAGNPSDPEGLEQAKR